MTAIKVNSVEQGMYRFVITTEPKGMEIGDI